MYIRVSQAKSGDIICTYQGSEYKFKIINNNSKSFEYINISTKKIYTHTNYNKNLKVWLHKRSEVDDTGMDFL